MRRGEIWWANLPKPMGHRPVVLVSRDTAIQLREAVTIAQVTTRVRDIPTEVPLGPEEGLSKKCVVNCDVLATIPKAYLQKRIAPLSREKLAELNAALGFALDISYHY
ncbi:MAG: type II toxin-antitoxin system PemK/MazF family toxin [Elusimicrobiota bacterium]|jgi:mRNA interferase MazF